MNAIELDFLAVGEETKSGDAIVLRYVTVDDWSVMIVDGGDLDAGSRIIDHIDYHFGRSMPITHAVCTHCDQDHVSGLRPVLETGRVQNLWVHQPWKHAWELNPLFKGNWTDENLAHHLKRESFPLVGELCDLAERVGTALNEPLAGNVIGPFTVLAPSGPRLAELIVQMDQTPAQMIEGAVAKVFRKAKQAIYSVFETWSIETLQDPGPNGTSVPNESSVVLYSPIGGGVVLTGDAGVGALQDAIGNSIALSQPIIRPAFVQIPHHGSRHNVSPAVLDQLLGPKFDSEVVPFCMAYASVAAKSEMPRRQVENAFRRRGYNTQSTKGRQLTWKHGFPGRPLWSYGLQPGPFHSFVEA